MVDMKIGGATFEDVDRIQLNKSDLSGVVNFMESADFLDIFEGPNPLNPQLTLYENPYLTTLAEAGAHYVSNYVTVYLENVTYLGFQGVWNVVNCKKIILPKLGTLRSHFTYNASCQCIDLTAVTAIEHHSLAGNSLATLILRGNSVPTLETTGQRASGITVYVPTAMIASYQADTNWSAMTGWTLTALEGSAYESQDWFRS